VSVNFPVAVPLTATRSSWPVETDKVPALAGSDGVDDDGVDDDGVDDDEEPAVDVGFVVAEAEPVAPGAPGDRKASGAVVPSCVEAEGADPFPPRTGPRRSQTRRASIRPRPRPTAGSGATRR
jgi:hypothetical protein